MGGGGVDTSAAERYAGIASQMGQTNFKQGQQLLTQNELPLLADLRTLANIGGAGGKYVSPLMNELMQPGIYASKQATTQAQKRLLGENLGPGAQATGMMQLDLQNQANMGNIAMQTVQQALTQLMGAGQQGTGMMTQAPQAELGAAQIATQIAGMKAQADAAGNQMLGGIFSTIGTLGGLALMGPLGGMAGGALGGMFGGGGGLSVPGMSNQGAGTYNVYNAGSSGGWYPGF